MSRFETQQSGLQAKEHAKRKAESEQLDLPLEASPTRAPFSDAGGVHRAAAADQAKTRPRGSESHIRSGYRYSALGASPRRLASAFQRKVEAFSISARAVGKIGLSFCETPLIAYEGHPGRHPVTQCSPLCTQAGRECRTFEDKQAGASAGRTRKGDSLEPKLVRPATKPAPGLVEAGAELIGILRRAYVRVVVRSGVAPLSSTAAPPSIYSSANRPRSEWVRRPGWKVGRHPESRSNPGCTGCASPTSQPPNAIHETRRVVGTQARHASRVTGLADWLFPGRDNQGV